MQNARLKWLLLLCCCYMLQFSFAGNNGAVKTIVIDAGHGGKDPGAIGPDKINEKDVALAVALKLGDYIQKNFPDVKVIYTRKTDQFLELHERADIANQHKADLFICIHCNSSPVPSTYGTSTYVLGLHRTEANLEVAKRENSVILMEGDRDKNYEFDPNSPEGNIIMSMKQNAFLDQSIDFASKIEGQFENYAKRKSLGVKQAGFYVLYKTTMPSLLSEIGFVSNPEEEKFLASQKGQEQLATALFKAFKEYKFEMEAHEGEVAKTQTPANTEEKTTTTPTKVEESVKEESPVKQDETEKPETPPAQTEQSTTTTNSAVVTPSGKIIHKPIESNSGGGVTNAGGQPNTAPTTPAADNADNNKSEPDQHVELPPGATPPSPDKDNDEKEVIKTITEPAKTEPKPVKQPTATTTATRSTPVKTEPKPVKQQTATNTATEKVSQPVTGVKPVNPGPPHPPASNKKPAIEEQVTESGVVFKVQLFAIKVNVNKTDYERITHLFTTLSTETLASGIVRYYAGDERSFGEAKKLLTTAKGGGYPDAFIVGFKNGARMNPTQLKEYEK